MTGFAFYALGEPGPQGSKVRNRYGAVHEASAKVAPWRDTVVAAAPIIAAPLDGPLAVKMVFTLRRPKAAPKRLTRPATTPDLDKLARSTGDALKTAGLVADDARICEYVRLAKVWTGFDPDALPVPGVIISCCQLDDIDPDGLDAFSGSEEVLCPLFEQARAAAWDRIRGAA